MAATVGELFVNLGIKGSDKTIGAIRGVTSSLDEAKSMSLQAKAGIIAVLWGLERLMMSAMRTGNGIANFSALTGMSAKNLQQWQYAAEKAGASANDMSGAFSSAQSILTKMRMGEVAPKGLFRVAELTGGISEQEIEKMMQDPEVLMRRLQEYALKEKDIGVRNEMLRSFGISDQIISAMAKGAFKPEILAKAPVISDQNIKNLDKMYGAVKEISKKIETTLGNIFAKHGKEIIPLITDIIDKVGTLANKLITLAEKLKVFEAIAWVLKMMGAGVEDITKTSSNVGEAISRKGIVGGLEERAGLVGEQYMLLGRALFQSLREAVEPKMPLSPAGALSGQQNFNINQTLNFQHDGKDAHKTSDSVGRAVQNAVRQLPQ